MTTQQVHNDLTRNGDDAVTSEEVNSQAVSSQNGETFVQSTPLPTARHTTPETQRRDQFPPPMNSSPSLANRISPLSPRSLLERVAPPKPSLAERLSDPIDSAMDQRHGPFDREFVLSDASMREGEPDGTRASRSRSHSDYVSEVK